MKTKISQVGQLLLCICLIASCGPIAKEAQIDTPNNSGGSGGSGTSGGGSTVSEKIIIGTYNFSSVSGDCFDLCYKAQGGPCSTVWEEVEDWKWEEVPKGTIPPEFIDVDLKSVAFVPTVPGIYKLSARFKCISSEGGDSQLATKRYEAVSESLAMSSTNVYPAYSGSLLEKKINAEKEKLNSTYDNRWVRNDFNADANDEFIIIDGASWTMLDKNYNVLISESSIIQDKEYNSSSLIGSTKSKENTNLFYIFAEPSDNYGLLIYSFDSANKVLKFEKDITNSVDITAVLNDSSLVENAHLYSNVATSYALDEDQITINKVGIFYMRYDAEFIDHIDLDHNGTEENLFKIGFQYFIYEEGN